MSSGQPASAPEAQPEIASSQKLLRQLDKASRAARTYGIANSVTARFLTQLEGDFTAHLDEFGVLAVVVERTELRQSGVVVYEAEEGASEGLAFRLYSDGIRELRFLHGLSGDELRAFVEALWDLDGDEGGDEDVVTRLWAMDLASIAFVTAEDIVRTPWTAGELEPQDHGFFAPPPASFRDVVSREQSAAAANPSDKPPAPAGVVGFEITSQEQERIDGERRTESASVPERYVLSALRAILASERSYDLRGRALSLFPDILDLLLSTGSWEALGDVIVMLERVGLGGGRLDPAHTMLAARIAYSINAPQRLTLLAKGLAADPSAPIPALQPILKRLAPPAAGALVQVLGTAESDEHRAALRDTLARIGARHPEPVLQALADPRPRLVRDVVAVIAAWGLPQSVDALAKLASHPDADVRRDAVAAITRLRPAGDGSPLVAFASDADRSVRMQALRALGTGGYATPWDAWRAHVASEELVQLPALDKRTLFHAVRATAGDAAVPWWQSLLVGRVWKQREQREETALVAVDVLEMLGTPAAAAALEAASRDASAPVRSKAASAAAALQRRRKEPSP